jgi:hypothetical protein
MQRAPVQRSPLGQSHLRTGELVLSLGVKLQDEALLNEEEEKSSYILNVLIRMYIKASAMVNIVTGLLLDLQLRRWGGM